MLVHLSPETRRRGIGTLLYRALEQKAIQWGLGRLHLDSTLIARSFYEALGFRSTGPAKKCLACCSRILTRRRCQLMLRS
jgi:GNAT superfamily N-acetyltransferase